MAGLQVRMAAQVEAGGTLVRMAAQAWMWEAWMREAQVMGPSVRVWLTLALKRCASGIYNRIKEQNTQEPAGMMSSPQHL